MRLFIKKCWQKNGYVVRIMLASNWYPNTLSDLGNVLWKIKLIVLEWIWPCWYLDQVNLQAYQGREDDLTKIESFYIFFNYDQIIYIKNCPDICLGLYVEQPRSCTKNIKCRNYTPTVYIFWLKASFLTKNERFPIINRWGEHKAGY